MKSSHHPNLSLLAHGVSLVVFGRCIFSVSLVLYSMAYGMFLLCGKAACLSTMVGVLGVHGVFLSSACRLGGGDKRF